MTPGCARSLERVRSRLQGKVLEGADGRYGFAIGTNHFEVVVERGQFRVADDLAGKPVVARIEMDEETFDKVTDAPKQLTIQTLFLTGKIKVDAWTRAVPFIQAIARHL